MCPSFSLILSTFQVKGQFSHPKLVQTVNKFTLKTIFSFQFTLIDVSSKSCLSRSVFDQQFVVHLLIYPPKLMLKSEQCQVMRMLQVVLCV